jgi:hypothetical protein
LSPEVAVLLTLVLTTVVPRVLDLVKFLVERPGDVRIELAQIAAGRDKSGDQLEPAIGFVVDGDDEEEEEDGRAR